MTRGKNICQTLKNIRQKIADANGIHYAPRECHYEGECEGTCPACEQEVKFIENELQIRRQKGFSVKVAGIAAGVCAVVMPMESVAQNRPKAMRGKVSIVKRSIPATDLTKGKADSVLLKGIVTDGAGEPLIGAVIKSRGARNCATTDAHGMFAVKVSPNARLEISSIGMETQTVEVKGIRNPESMTIVLKEDKALPGEIVAPVPVKKTVIVGSVILPEEQEQETVSGKTGKLRKNKKKHK